MGEKRFLVLVKADNKLIRKPFDMVVRGGATYLQPFSGGVDEVPYDGIRIFESADWETGSGSPR